ncbi:hypothetical protein [Bartonella sp. CR127HXZ]|uniref:hypothetical protein n=1 Tax=Bartonella sp. CR127HXZ TaxID=1460985 RepID=UPI0035D05C0C
MVQACSFIKYKDDGATMALLLSIYGRYCVMGKSTERGFLKKVCKLATRWCFFFERLDSIKERDKQKRDTICIHIIPIFLRDESFVKFFLVFLYDRLEKILLLKGFFKYS